MSTQVELLIALLSLLAGVLYAWFAVRGTRPWQALAAGCGARRRAGGGDFDDTRPSVLFHDSGTDPHTNQPAQ